jgi:hypothetical protein
LFVDHLTFRNFQDCSSSKTRQYPNLHDNEMH